MTGSRDVFGVGSLTDVAGVRVGHHQRTGSGWLTGTTVVAVPGGAAAAVDVRGGGPGTRETDALAPHRLVDRIHAICLTGGSAYGLAAADGVMAELERRCLGVPVGPEPAQVVPVVPTAVLFDLGRGGVFGHRPGVEFGRRAALAAFSARGVRPARGTIGAGTGARAGGIQGGVGMASARVATSAPGGPRAAVTVAALAVVNAAGSAIDPTTGAPWHAVPGMRAPSRPERAALAAAVASTRPAPSTNTTIGVVVTDAALERAELGALAQAAHDGLARAIRPVHLLVDGDTVFALSTGDTALPERRTGLVRDAPSRVQALDAITAAAADVFAVACADAVVTATGTRAHRAYRDVCPSAYRRLLAP
jgi:L-aminopeptidase/D-esterase-like protein